jgi:hypothetical protein
MRPRSQLKTIVCVLLILAGVSARHSLAQGPVNTQPAVLSQSDQDNSLPPAAPGVEDASRHTVSGPANAVVLRFAVASQPLPDTTTLSVGACSQTAVDESQGALTVTPATLDLITGEFQKRLSKTMPVLIDVDRKEIPTGATVFTGCITKSVAGNSAKKMLGFNLGASRVGAHVIVLTRTQSGFSPIDSFDIEVKGGNALPPLGPIGVGVRLAQVSRETDSATAKKLADQILKRVAKDKKSESGA